MISTMYVLCDRIQSFLLSSNLFDAKFVTKHGSTRPTVTAGSDHYIFTHVVRPSVRHKISKSSEKSLPTGTVGWPSGSLMIPVLCYLDSHDLRQISGLG